LIDVYTVLAGYASDEYIKEEEEGEDDDEPQKNG
jgi:hypothetical protein